LQFLLNSAILNGQFVNHYLLALVRHPQFLLVDVPVLSMAYDLAVRKFYFTRVKQLNLVDVELGERLLPSHALAFACNHFLEVVKGTQ
jgi:hypothetical protein